MPETPNHKYNIPNEGQTDWHVPLNENFESHDTDIEIRDVEADRGDYDPKDGAKYFATDTGQVFVGDGTSWNAVENTGPNPTFDSISTTGNATVDTLSTNGNAEFGNYVSVNGASQIGSNDMLGVQKQVSGNDFGGMFVDTAGSGEGKPYYGYSIDGSTGAYHYYDAAQNEWELYNNGSGMTVTQNGAIKPFGSDPHIRFPDGTAQRYAGPVAYGSVESDATLNEATGNVNSVTWDGNRYEIDIDNVRYNSNRYASSIQLTNIYEPENSARAAAANSNLVVYIFDGNGNEIKDDFHFVIHDP